MLNYNDCVLRSLGFASSSTISDEILHMWNSNLVLQVLWKQPLSQICGGLQKRKCGVSSSPWAICWTELQLCSFRLSWVPCCACMWETCRTECEKYCMRYLRNSALEHSFIAGVLRCSSILGSCIAEVRTCSTKRRPCWYLQTRES